MSDELEHWLKVAEIQDAGNIDTSQKSFSHLTNEEREYFDNMESKYWYEYNNL